MNDFFCHVISSAVWTLDSDMTDFVGRVARVRAHTEYLLNPIIDCLGTCFTKRTHAFEHIAWARASAQIFVCNGKE